MPLRSTTIKDYLRESQLFLGRAVAALVAVGLLTGVLLVRLIFLQVYGHEHYSMLSRDNRVKIEPLAPTRGLIYDRNGVLLADNQPAFSLEIIPEQVSELDVTIAELQEILHIGSEDLENFHRQRKRRRRFESIPIRHRLNEEEVSRFAVQRHRFPGVDIHARLYRYYPRGELTAHVLGYVGRIDESELQSLDTVNYRGTTHIGKVGVEKAYEDILHGHVGHRQVETNAEGRVLRILERTPPVPGNDLYLNLDIHLQQMATEALGDLNGAIVAIEPETGGVLALVSKPGYDPNLFVRGIDPQEYRALNASRDKPLFNRALRGQYPPGSTVKPFIGLAGLEYNVIDRDKHIFCPGYFQLPGKTHKYRDWKKWGHGHIAMQDAIAQSCDVYFYQLALSLGIDRMHEFMMAFGFGKPTGIDLVAELSGLMPSREWKRGARHEAWFPGETLITGIGQGYTLATPLQLAMATTVLARRGRPIQPRMVHAIHNPLTGNLRIVHLSTFPRLPIHNPTNWDLVIQSMIEVIHGPRGTARRIGQDAPYQMAGKTGTAQVFTLKQDEDYDKESIAYALRDHALFIAFAPTKQPRIAVAVVAEHGGSGGSVAAPMARHVIDAYLLGDAP